MNMPFCDVCPIRNKCIQNLSLFNEKTGNKRIPPEDFCKKQYEKFGIEYDDFHKKVLILEANNVHSIKRIYDIEDEIKEAGISYEPLPLNITLMITEKCNLRCKYCYEVFSGNMKAKSMPFEIAKKAIDMYMTKGNIAKNGFPNWDLVGGEIFFEFDLLRQIVEYLISKYIELGYCPKKHLNFHLCSNGTLFTNEVKDWCLHLKNRIKYFGLGVSLDGPKIVHDMNRSNSFDRVMSSFDWWRTNFPDCSIKGTLNPDTIQYLEESVKFFVEDLKLPQFYINPTFEGPWTEELAIIYSEQLINIATYFLEHPEYNLLKNSNVLLDTRIHKNEPSNWCGSGIYMRAITPDGSIYPCLRAATSRLYKLGSLETGVDKERIKPFYFYTKYNDIDDCNSCKWVTNCPSCVMEWAEDTGDIYLRSTKFCLMTKARLLVSKYYCDQTKEEVRFN